MNYEEKMAGIKELLTTHNSPKTPEGVPRETFVEAR